MNQIGTLKEFGEAIDAVSSRKSLLLLLYECPTPVSLTTIENILKSLIETAYE